MKYGDIIIFDNETGQAISFPQTSCLLTWSKEMEEIFPEGNSYWAVGIVRKATEQEIKTVRWGVKEDKNGSKYKGSLSRAGDGTLEGKSKGI